MDLFGIAKIAFFLFYVYTAGHIVDSMSGPALVGELIAGATLGPHLTGFMPETVSANVHAPCLRFADSVVSLQLQ
jgi:predicted Kef-type K+ transport protein